MEYISLVCIFVHQPFVIEELMTTTRGIASLTMRPHTKVVRQGWCIKGEDYSVNSGHVVSSQQQISEKQSPSPKQALQKAHHFVRPSAKMCKVIQYYFMHCPSRRCPGNMRPFVYELCAEAAAQGYPPDLLSHNLFGLACCQREERAGLVQAMCRQHQERLCELGMGPRMDPYADINITPDMVRDDLIYLVERTPWANPQFRAVDWNPAPRTVPLDSPQLSPRSSPVGGHSSGGVLKSYYDPAHWYSADGRFIVMFQDPTDPPQLSLDRPPFPEAEPDLLDVVEEQLTNLVAN